MPRGRIAQYTVEPGRHVGRLTILRETRMPDRPSGRKGDRAAVCRCDCGAEITVALANLVERDGHVNTQSCGCLLADRRIESHTTHGHARKSGRHPLYFTWNMMKQRCENPNNRKYRRYGARGILVCDEWRNDPAAFIAWIEQNLGQRPAGMTLDRIDNDGNYEPGNVRWATPRQQRANQTVSGRPAPSPSR